jgi:class 3 adenylate cyclase
MPKANNSKYLKKLSVIFGITLAVNLLVSGFYYLPREFDFAGLGGLLRSLEETSVNWRFTSKLIVSGGIALRGDKGSVIAYQERNGIFKKLWMLTGDADSIDYFGSYPFDNRVWADMVSHFGNLSNGKGPAALFLEPMWTKPSPNPESDTAFFQALADYPGLIGGNVLLESFSEKNVRINKPSDIRKILNGRPINRLFADYRAPEALALRKHELSVPDWVKRNIPQYARPLSMLQESVEPMSFFGTANMDQEFGTFRKMPMVSLCWYYYADDEGTIRVTNAVYPSSVLSLVLRLSGAGGTDISYEPDAIVIRNITNTDYFVGLKNGVLRIPVDQHFRLAVNYKANLDSDYINKMSMRDVLQSSFQPGCIFLFGMHTTGSALKQWQTPVGSMYGVEQVAYAIGTVLNHDFLIEVPAWVNILFLLALTLLVGYLVSRGTRFTILGGVIAIILPIVAGTTLFQFNIQIFMMVALVTCVVVLILGEIYMILTERRERKFIEETFSSYVNPDLVNILIQNPGMMDLGGGQKEVTMLFSDIRGFTTISEGMEPMQLVDFINDYLTRMTDIVLATGGTLDKYIGDAVVAFWGAPIPMKDHAVQACRASVQMLHALAEFNRIRAEKGFQTVRIGIGLNTGPVTVGNIGSEKKKNYTAIGEHATLTEDLQDANKAYHTGIILSETTYEPAKDFIIARELDLIPSAAHDRLIRIYELIDMKE